MNDSVCMIVLCICFGYILGNINPTYIISKIKGIDIRVKGSGNPGASNAAMVLGKKAGIFCGLFDIFKAYLAVKITTKLYPLFKMAGMLTGMSCVLGHIYPVTMKFKGGKGLACLSGVLLAYNNKLFIAMLLFEVVVVLVTSYICMVATSGSLIFGLFVIIKEGPVYAWIIIIYSGFFIFIHILILS